MNSLADHLLVISAELPKVGDIAVMVDEAWRTHLPDYQCVIDALEDSLLGSYMQTLWGFSAFPVPHPQHHQKQLELLLKRDTDCTRASVERILYELFRLKTSHIWELEDHLWP